MGENAFKIGFFVVVFVVKVENAFKRGFFGVVDVVIDVVVVGIVVVVLAGYFEVVNVVVETRLFVVVGGNKVVVETRLAANLLKYCR